MADTYAPELKDAINKIELMTLSYKQKNHAAPTKLLINDDDEDQSWLMWAAQILDMPIEKTTKHRTKVV